MNSGSSSECSTSIPSNLSPTPARRRVLRSTSKMQRRPRPASPSERRNQLLPVPAPPRTAITRRCWRGRRLKGLTLGFVVLLISLKSPEEAGSGLKLFGGGPHLAPTGGELAAKSGVSPRIGGTVSQMKQGCNDFSYVQRRAAHASR